MSSQTTTPASPFANALDTVIAKLTALKAHAPKAFGSFPLASDFDNVAAHIREVAEICDEWIEAVGFQVADNAYGVVDQRSFEDAISAGLTDAAYTCEHLADEMRDARRAA